jgi:hypothetical protein
MAESGIDHEEHRAALGHVASQIGHRIDQEQDAAAARQVAVQRLDLRIEEIELWSRHHHHRRIVGDDGRLSQVEAGRREALLFEEPGDAGVAEALAARGVALGVAGREVHRGGSGGGGRFSRLGAGIGDIPAGVLRQGQDVDDRQEPGEHGDARRRQRPDRPLEPSSEACDGGPARLHDHGKTGQKRDRRPD